MEIANLSFNIRGSDFEKLALAMEKVAEFRRNHKKVDIVVGYDIEGKRINLKFYEQE